MENLGQKQTIVIKRVKKGGHGHHGGAWKVAMADFALAMMALFMVLWIISSASEEQRAAISSYFQDPKAFEQGSLAPSNYVIDMGGTPPNRADNIAESGTPDPDKVLTADEIDSMSAAIEKRRMEQQAKALESSIAASSTLSPFKNQLLVDITTEGVRLQIVDQTNRPMFAAGSTELNYYAEDILWELAPLLASLSNQLSISGHTNSDQQAKSSEEDDKNWLLSAARADAARKALMEAGVAKKQIAQVIGKGDTAPLVLDDPYSPINRRIAITLLNQKEPKDGEDETEYNFINDEYDGAFEEESTPNPEVKSTLDKAGQTIDKLRQEREAQDNSYDNPPNKNEAFW